MVRTWSSWVVSRRAKKKYAVTSSSKVGSTCSRDEAAEVTVPRLTSHRQFAGVRCVTAHLGRPTLFRRLRSPNNERHFVTPDKRSILGSDGWEWLVREFVSRDVGAISRSLVFERPEVVRRVRDYPRDWASLSDEQLYRLSLRT